MKKLKISSWQDPVIGLLGAWFAVSPWVLGYANLTDASAASVLLGLGLVAMAVAGVAKGYNWARWGALALGLGAAAAPWVLGFGEQTDPARNALGVGLLSALLAAWMLVRGHAHRSGSWRGDWLAH